MLTHRINHSSFSSYAWNCSIRRFSSMYALSMLSRLLAPVNTTLPEANSKTDFTKGRVLYTTPGKLSFLKIWRCSHSFPMFSLNPRSALATMLVILKSFIFDLMFRALEISVMTRFATYSAWNSESDPITMILPDLKHRIVLLGSVFLIITAGNLFLLKRDPSTFSAMILRFISSSNSISAYDTTFWMQGNPLVLVFQFFFLIFAHSNRIFSSVKYLSFFKFLWVRHIATLRKSTLKKVEIQNESFYSQKYASQAI